MLDGGAAASIAPVSVATVDNSGRAGNFARAVSDQVNQSFDAFTRDLLQVQGAYFASISPNASTNAKQLYSGYITQRLNLLSQQLTRVFVQLPGSLNRLKGSSFGGGGGSIVLQTFLRNRVTGNGASSLHRALVGTTGRNTIPNSIPVGDLTATLYTSQVLAAIETSRTATLNSSNFLLNSTFKNGRKP